MLNAQQCYRALKSRDHRFDGRFFTAVLTTGIYCRPICPATTPKFENIRFYSCAAAAEEAGFRPCLRCRPETSPGTPAWLGTSATVSRALRLISDGVLDEGGVDDLVLATRGGLPASSTIVPGAPGGFSAGSSADPARALRKKSD